MKLLLSLIILLCGAILNIAIPWLLAAYINVFTAPGESGYLAEREFSLEIARHRAIGSLRIVSLRTDLRHDTVSRSGQDLFKLVSPFSSLLQASDEFTEGSTRMEMQWADARGWPCYSLSCKGVSVDSGSLSDGILLASNPWMRGGIVTQPRVLPLSPLLPGFIINLLFYWVALGAMVIGISKTRKSYRTRRSRCIACGYQLTSGQSRCPECGQLVQSIRDEAQQA